jgi:hypothetical protein
MVLGFFIAAGFLGVHVSGADGADQGLAANLAQGEGHEDWPTIADAPHRDEALFGG